MSWRENKVLTAVLLVAALGIWAAVGYTVLDGLSGNGEKLVASTPTAHFSTSDTAVRADFVYVADFRDPFTPQIWPPREESYATDDEYDAVASIESEHEFVPESPRFRLVAIVGETAIIETASGLTQVVSAGDYLGDVRFDHIGSTHVLLDQYGHEFQVHLD